MANIDNPNPTLRRNPEYGKLLNLDPDAPPTAHDGLMRDAETGHLIGIEQTPVVPHPDVGAEYPRWVTPHASHVNIRKTDTEMAAEAGKEPEKSELKQDGDNLIIPCDSVVSVPGYQHHVRRGDGAIMVLVNNKEEEDRVLGEHSDDHEPVPYIDPVELAAAQRVLDREKIFREYEYDEKRLAEIIKERRKASLDQAEKDLEEQRKHVDNVPDIVRSSNSPSGYRDEQIVARSEAEKASIENKKLEGGI